MIRTLIAINPSHIELVYALNHKEKRSGIISLNLAELSQIVKLNLHKTSNQIASLCVGASIKDTLDYTLVIYDHKPNGIFHEVMKTIESTETNTEIKFRFKREDLFIFLSNYNSFLQNQYINTSFWEGF